MPRRLDPVLLAAPLALAFLLGSLSLDGELAELAALPAAAAAERPDAPRHVAAGASFVAPGFVLDLASRGADAESVWLVDARRGLELHLAGWQRAPGESREEEARAWLEGLPEEPGFRVVRAEERGLPAGRARVRLYGGDEDEAGARSWTTAAALVAGAERSWAVTILAPPGARAEGEAALRVLLESLRPAR